MVLGVGPWVGFIQFKQVEVDFFFHLRYESCVRFAPLDQDLHPHNTVMWWTDHSYGRAVSVIISPVSRNGQLKMLAPPINAACFPSFDHSGHETDFIRYRQRPAMDLPLFELGTRMRR